MNKLHIFFCLTLFLLACQEQKNNQDHENDKFEQKQDSTSENSITTNEARIDSLVNEYEDPNRVNWQNPELVIDKIGALKDLTVADIGAGSGYFTFRLINKAKKIIAVDIEQDLLEFINERKSGLNREISSKLETRLVEPDNPGLEENEVDVVLLVNTYLNIESRVGYLEKLKEGIKPKGRIVIVDFKTGDLPTGPPDDLKVAPEIAEAELLQAGFMDINTDTVSLKFQYIIIAQTDK